MGQIRSLEEESPNIWIIKSFGRFVSNLSNKNSNCADSALSKFYDRPKPKNTGSTFRHRCILYFYCCLDPPKSSQIPTILFDFYSSSIILFAASQKRSIIHLLFRVLSIVSRCRCRSGDEFLVVMTSCSQGVNSCARGSIIWSCGIIWGSFENRINWGGFRTLRCKR